MPRRFRQHEEVTTNAVLRILDYGAKPNLDDCIVAVRHLQQRNAAQALAITGLKEANSMLFKTMKKEKQ